MTPTEINELVRRLKRYRPSSDGVVPVYGVVLKSCAAALEAQASRILRLEEALKPIYEARVGLEKKAQKGYYICEGYDLTYAELLKASNAYARAALVPDGEKK